MPVMFKKKPEDAGNGSSTTVPGSFHKMTPGPCIAVHPHPQPFPPFTGDRVRRCILSHFPSEHDGIVNRIGVLRPLMRFG